MSRRAAGWLRLALKARSGTAAVEFTIIAPVLLAMLIGGNELTRMLRGQRHVENYVTTVAFDLAGVSTSISDQQLQEMLERFYLMAPELRDGAGSPWNFTNVGIAMTMVEMSSCGANCYTAKVAWSAGTMKRACGTLSSSGTGAFSLTTLPAAAFQGTPVVVVDVSATYSFIFGANFLPQPTISKTVFFPVRDYLRTTTYIPTSPLWAKTVKCAGYP